MRTRFLIVEARRLLPLLFLLLLLVGLSVYDNFFRFEAADHLRERAEGEVIFTTADHGAIDLPLSFLLVYEQDDWERKSDHADSPVQNN